MLRSIDHFIGGSSFASGERQGEVFDPNQGQVQAHVGLGSSADLDKAVAAARAAQPAWAATNPQRRARVMFKYRELVEAHMDELAELLSSEHGKVLADSRGDVQRGLEVIEYACGIPQALKGEYTVGAGTGIDVYSMRQRRRDHSVQLPRDDPDVDVRNSDRCGQCVHPETERARSERARPACRADD